jgi:hypothetical protein
MFLLRKILPDLLLPSPPLKTKRTPQGRLTDPWMADTAAEALEAAKAIDLPPSFLLGAATAAYQVEGGLDQSNWAAWERSGRNNGHAAGKACDSWNLFEADIEHMKALGLRMMRFSIDWSRLEPEAGRFDLDALERYARWCEKLRAASIEPMITLCRRRAHTLPDADAAAL